MRPSRKTAPHVAMKTIKPTGKPSRIARPDAGMAAGVNGPFGGPNGNVSRPTLPAGAPPAPTLPREMANPRTRVQHTPTRTT